MTTVQNRSTTFFDIVMQHADTRDKQNWSVTLERDFTDENVARDYLERHRKDYPEYRLGLRTVTTITTIEA
jgi:uncharacterized protein (DUF924 family)